MSIIPVLADIADIDEKTATRLMKDFNDGLQEISKSTLHFKHLYLLLNLPKRPIREQRFLCLLMGLSMEHNYITKIVSGLHNKPLEENE